MSIYMGKRTAASPRVVQSELDLALPPQNHSDGKEDQEQKGSRFGSDQQTYSQEGWHSLEPTARLPTIAQLGSEGKRQIGNPLERGLIKNDKSFCGCYTN